MGVDHGGKGPPRIWSKGTLMQIVRVLACTKKRPVAFKIRQNPFFGREAPETAGEPADAPSDLLVGCAMDTPPHTPPHAAPTHLRSRHV